MLKEEEEKVGVKMTQTETAHSTDIRARKMYKILKPYIGKIVKVNFAYISEYRKMMYAGQQKDGARWSWADFVTSKEESLDGTIVFNGVCCHLEGIGANNKGEFTIYANSGSTPHPLPHCNEDKKRLEELIALWDQRRK